MTQSYVVSGGGGRQIIRFPIFVKIYSEKIGGRVKVSKSGQEGGEGRSVKTQKNTRHATPHLSNVKSVNLLS